MGELGIAGAAPATNKIPIEKRKQICNYDLVSPLLTIDF